MRHLFLPALLVAALIAGLAGCAAMTGKSEETPAETVALADIPAPARADVEEMKAQLEKAGINGIFSLGETSEPLCQIPVAANRIGLIQLGGLNPVAAAVEAGIEVENIAESGVIDFSELKSFWDL